MADCNPKWQLPTTDLLPIQTAVIRRCRSNSIGKHCPEFYRIRIEIDGAKIDGGGQVTMQPVGTGTGAIVHDVLPYMQIWIIYLVFEWICTCLQFRLLASRHFSCILFSNNLLRLSFVVIFLCKFLVSQELGIHSEHKHQCIMVNTQLKRVYPIAYQPIDIQTTSIRHHTQCRVPLSG